MHNPRTLALHRSEGALLAAPSNHNSVRGQLKLAAGQQPVLVRHEERLREILSTCHLARRPLAEKHAGEIRENGDVAKICPSHRGIIRI